MRIPKKRLRHRLTMKQETGNDTDEDPSYGNYMTGVPCDITPVSGGESYLGKKLQETTRLAIVTRYNQNFKPDFRAINEHTLVTYEFTHLHDLGGRQQFWLMEATEVVL